MDSMATLTTVQNYLTFHRPELRMRPSKRNM
jgi:hypothetical protein